MPMMKCGHIANGKITDSKTDETKPCCVICSGIDPGADEIAESPNLEGRLAKCAECGRVAKSSDFERLAFFEYRGEGSARSLQICTCGYSKTAHEKPESTLSCRNFTPRGAYEYDSYYCGCHGWD